MDLLSSITIFMLLALLVLTQEDRGRTDPNNHFIFPPPARKPVEEDPSVYELNYVFTVGMAPLDQFEWVTNMSMMYIQIDQKPDKGKDGHTYQLTECDGRKTYDWNGKIGPISLANGNVAFLSAWNCSKGIKKGEGPPVFYSHYFNLTEAEPKEKPSTSSSTASASPTQSASAAQTSELSSSNTSATIVGGAVGGGLGAVCLALAFTLWLLYRKRRGEKRDRQSGISAQRQGIIPPDLLNRTFVGTYQPGQSQYQAYGRPAELSPDVATNTGPQIPTWFGRPPPQIPREVE